MSSKSKSQRAKSRHELYQQMAFYRAHLEYEGEWPEKADELIKHLAGKAPNQELMEADLEMLSLVVNDALQGVDIQKKYPAFYIKLVKDAVLRDAFLDILEMAEE